MELRTIVALLLATFFSTILPVAASAFEACNDIKNMTERIKCLGQAGGADNPVRACAGKGTEAEVAKCVRGLKEYEDGQRLLRIEANSKNECRMTGKEQEEVFQCVKKYNDLKCDELAETPEDRENLTTCSPYELLRTADERNMDWQEACYTKVKEDVIQLVQTAIALPDILAKMASEGTAAARQAQGICEKIRETDAEYAKQLRYANPQMLDQVKSQWMFECMGREIQKIRPPTLGPFAEEQWRKIKHYASNLYEYGACMTPEGRARVLCPLIAGFIGGAATGLGKAAIKQAIVKRRLVKAAALGAAGKRFTEEQLEAMYHPLNLRRIYKDAKKELDEVHSHAKTEAERQSIQHQDDILSKLTDPKKLEDWRKRGLDPEAMIKGEIDSDKGKLSHYRQKALLEPSPESDHFIRVMQGDLNSPAGRAINDLMRENGVQSFGILPSHLNPGEIRHALNKRPALQGYLHEIPGMMDAVGDFEKALAKAGSNAQAQRIATEQFKRRVGANLFHNGPDEGFWKFFGNGIIGPSMADSTDEVLTGFFRTGAMRGETRKFPLKNPDGTPVLKPDGTPVEFEVHMPSYKNPITPEGRAHAGIDRLSGGTRGGTEKFFHELFEATITKMKKEGLEPTMGAFKNPGGVQNGIGSFRSITHGNHGQTVDQLKVLRKAAESDPHLSPAQRAAELAEIDGHILRVQKVDDFIRGKPDANGRFTNGRIRFDKDGALEMPTKAWVKVMEGEPPREVVKEIDLSTKTDEALKVLRQVYADEEKVNGNPFPKKTVKDLPSPPSIKPSLARLGAFGTGVESLMLCGSEIPGRRLPPPRTEMTEP